MKTTLPSDRSFGWTFTGLFVLAGAWGLWRGGAHYPLTFALAALTAIVTLARPLWLAPLKRAWMRLGEILNRVVSPVVMAVIFFGVFTPIGWAMRLAGRDAMSRTFNPAAKSYWVSRSPPGPADDSFRDLF